MNVLDLFSGIGGFSLGLERAGMRTVAFCEIDPYCQAVLRKHWPDVICWTDVRAVNYGPGFVDVICGGFPCQDISAAGPRTGIDGERSGLWREYARLIGQIRPRYAIVENVADLRIRGLGTVLGDLATLGYDAEWHCIPASYVGSPQRRDRIWIVAYPSRGETRRQIASDGSSEVGSGWTPKTSPFGRCLSLLRGTDWHSEPKVGRVVDGISANVDSVSALGNAVVPQIPEIIGRAIMQAEGLT